MVWANYLIFVYVDPMALGMSHASAQGAFQIRWPHPYWHWGIVRFRAIFHFGPKGALVHLACMYI